MKQTIILLACILCFVYAQSETTVTFQVDMSLITGVNEVGVRGDTAPLDWATSVMLSDENNDDIWTGDAAFDSQAGEVLYKFIYNETEWEGLIDNRSFTVDPSGGTQILPVVWFNDISATNQDVTVTFAVDMSVVADIGTVYLAGDFTDWQTDWIEMTDSGEDIFVTDVFFPAGSSVSHQYKFVNELPTQIIWEDDPNRFFNIDETSPTQVLPTVYFNNIFPSISQDVTVTFIVDMSSVTPTDVYIMGSTPPLSWTDGVLLTDIGNSQYSVGVIFVEGTPSNVEYKYRNGDDWEVINGDPYINRFFLIDDSSPQMQLPIDYWGVMVSIDEEMCTIEKTDLRINIFPNPFFAGFGATKIGNAQTTIRFSISHSQKVSLNIYNIKGQKVKSLLDEVIHSGTHNIVWDGKDNVGKSVSSGLYFTIIETEKNCNASKLILFK